MKVSVSMLGGDIRHFDNVDEVCYATDPDRLILWQNKWSIKIVIPTEGYVLHKEDRA